MKSFDCMSYSMNKGVSFLRLCSLSFPKVHAGYPNKNNNNGKIESASLFPLPIMLRALSFSFSPVSRRQKEASAEESWLCSLCLGQLFVLFCAIRYRMNIYTAKKLWCCVVGMKSKNLVLYNKWVDKSRFTLIKVLLEMPAS